MTAAATPPGASGAPVVLRVRDLRVSFDTPAGRVRALRGVDLDVRAGQTLAVVGESGSGKSVTALSLLGEVRGSGRVDSGAVAFHGRDLFAMPEAERAALRGDRISMVFQDPMNALDPVMRVGAQLEETIRVKRPGLGGPEVRARAMELLRVVGIPAPERRCHDYPFAFSGGMRQRIVIALALCGEPEVLVADEPTTALDVTVQAQILRVFARLNREYGTAVVLVTHNFGVVAELCDEVAVMYAGRVVERARLPEVFTAPRHPYTRALIDSVPHLGARRDRRLRAIEGAPPDLTRPLEGCSYAPRCARALDSCATRDPHGVWDGAGGEPGAACWNPVPLDAARGDAAVTTPSAPRAARSSPGTGDESAAAPLAGRALTRHHRVRSRLFSRGGAGVVRAVDGVDVSVAPGETLGIVGESGCGKSSLARLLVRIDEPTGGTVTAGGRDVTGLSGRRLAPFRRSVQMIFQDPKASLNPRKTIGALLDEPLLVHGIEPDPRARRKRSAELLEAVGFGADALDRRPGQFSGGQLQRICIARALAVDPRVLICDEAVSALDVSLQAQVVNLLDELQAERGLSYVFISHDVSLVRYFSHRVTVMYLGTAVETGPAATVLDAPLHPYTRGLVASVPEPSAASVERRARRAPALTGELPSPLDPPAGCRFHTRCPLGPLHHEGRARCTEEAPVLREIRPGRSAACHFAEELLDAGSPTAP
ncbi:dipeptide ABC transporter ATP-binding protein [Streptomyces sp. NPDC050560]|uniref:dipeptide ABC transporter ATP-binding protein n=1 Tax=Streptomyces sp. NPDC050560 TaxID=3365630 RepID=UPI0037A0867F